MKTNVYFKHAVLTKLVLIAALLFVSLWLWDLEGSSLINSDGDLLPTSGVRNTDSTGIHPTLGTGQPIEETKNLQVSALKTDMIARRSLISVKRDYGRDDYPVACAPLLDVDCDRTSNLAYLAASSFILSCSEISVEGNSGLRSRAKPPFEATTSLYPSSAIRPTPRPNTNLLRAETFLLHDNFPSSACPQRVLAPAQSVFLEKISGGELYNRLIEERYVPWREPTAKDLGVK